MSRTAMDVALATSQEGPPPEPAPHSWKSRYSGRASIVLLRLGFVLLFTFGMTGMGVFAWWMNSTHARSSTGELALDLGNALLRQASGEFVSLFSSTRNMVLAMSDIMHSGLLVIDSTDPSFDPAAIAKVIWPVFHRMPLINFLGYQAVVGQTLITLTQLSGGLPSPALLFQNGTTAFYIQAVDAAGSPLGEPALVPLPPKDLREDTWFQTSLASTREELVYVFASTWPGPMMTISAPVFSPSGDILAVVGTSVLLTQLSTFLASLPLRGGDMFVTMAHGQLVASSHDVALVRDTASTITVFETTDEYIKAAAEVVLRQLMADRVHCLRHPTVSGCADADSWLVPGEVANNLVISPSGAGRDFEEPAPVLVPDFVAWRRARPGCLHLMDELGDAGLTYISVMLLEADRGLSMVAVLLIPRGNIMGDIDETSNKTLLVILLVALATAAIGSVVTLTLTRKVKKEVELGQELEVMNLQLREMKHRAEVSNETKSAFLANISHEIRTPMTSILGCVDLLLMDPLLGSARSSVEIIKRASTMLLNILNSLLDLAKIDSGKMELEEDSVDLWGMLSSLVDMYSVNVGKRSIDVILDLAENVPHVVRGDVTRIQQILNNLCGNALKFTLAGHVAVRARVLEADSPADRDVWAQVIALRRRPPAGSSGGRNFFGSGSRRRMRHCPKDAHASNPYSGTTLAFSDGAPAGRPAASAAATGDPCPINEERGVGQCGPGGAGSKAKTLCKAGGKVGRLLRRLLGRSFRDRIELARALPSEEGSSSGPLDSPSHLWLEFEVDDSGVGIPPSKWEAVFDDFNQADTSTTRVYGGTGLGLSIVRRLVRLMKGDIVIAPKEGPGTLFRFWICLRRCDCRLHNLPIDESGNSSPREGSFGGRRCPSGSFTGTAFRLLSTMSHAADRGPSFTSTSDAALAQRIEALRGASCRDSGSSADHPSVRSFSKGRFCGMAGCAAPECARMSARPTARRPLSRPVLLCMRPGMARRVAAAWVGRMGAPVLVADTLDSLFKLAQQMRGGAWGGHSDGHDGGGGDGAEDKGAKEAANGPMATEGMGTTGVLLSGRAGMEHESPGLTHDLACSCRKGAAADLSATNGCGGQRGERDSVRKAVWLNHLLSQSSPANDANTIAGLMQVHDPTGARAWGGGALPLTPATCPVHGDHAARPAGPGSAPGTRPMGGGGFIVVMEEAVLMRAAVTLPSAEALVSSVSLGLVAMSKHGGAEGREGRGGQAGVVGGKRARSLTDLVGGQFGGDDAAVVPASAPPPVGDTEAAATRPRELVDRQWSCPPAMQAVSPGTQLGPPGMQAAPASDFSMSDGPLADGPLRGRASLEPNRLDALPSSPSSPSSSSSRAISSSTHWEMSSGSETGGHVQAVVELAARVARDASTTHNPSRSPRPSGEPPTHGPSHLRPSRGSDPPAGMPDLAPSQGPLLPRPPASQAREQRRKTHSGSVDAHEGRRSANLADVSGRGAGAGAGATFHSTGGPHCRNSSAKGNADYVQAWSRLDDVKDRMEEVGVSLVLLANCNGASSGTADAPFDDLALHSAVRRVGTLVYLPLHRMRLQEALQEAEAEFLRPKESQALTRSEPPAKISPLQVKLVEHDPSTHPLQCAPPMSHVLLVDACTEARASVRANAELARLGLLATAGLPATACKSALLEGPAASALMPAWPLVHAEAVGAGGVAAPSRGAHPSGSITAAPSFAAQTPATDQAPATAAASVKALPPPAPAALPVVTDAGGAHEERPLVLLVEDTEINQRIFRKMLLSMGVDVDVASDGVEAVEAWKKKAYDLVLMDCQLPVLDGYEATMAIRSLEAQGGGVGGGGRVTPIVALTADAMVANRRRCEEAGMTSFLTKPISHATLQRSVAAWSLRKPKKARGSAT